MDWLEVSVQADSETAEAVSEVLARYAHNGVVIEAGHPGQDTIDVTVRGYLPGDERAPAAERSIREALWHLGQIRPVAEPEFRSIPDADWTVAWREKLNVLHIGRNIVVRPTWRVYAPRSDDIVIDLDPGQAFGTGLHPTTQLCLAAIEDLVSAGASVLDIGTGSGILSIAAAKLGATRVLALDTDPVAVRAARGNVADNHVGDRVTVREGSLGDAGGSHDLVVVNILLHTILRLLDDGLSGSINPGGHLVLAGILVDQEAQVEIAAAAKGLHPVNRWVSGDWVARALARSV